MSTITLVQHTGLDAGTTASASLAFPSDNVSGNWIGVIIRAGGINQGLTVTDTRGNSYRLAVQFNETVDGTTLGIFFAENIRGGANVVTVAGTQTNTLRFAVVEYAGVAATSSLDAVATAQGTSSTPSVGPITTTAAGDLVLGLVSTANPATFTPGSGYTVEQWVPSEPGAKLILEDRMLTTAGSVSAGASLGASDTWGAAIAAFRAGGGNTSDTQAPTAPGSLTATPSNSTQINLSWTASTDNVGVTAYQVDRCSGAGCSNFAHDRVRQ